MSEACRRRRDCETCADVCNIFQGTETVHFHLGTGAGIDPVFQQVRKRLKTVETQSRERLSITLGSGEANRVPAHPTSVGVLDLRLRRPTMPSRVVSMLSCAFFGLGLLLVGCGTEPEPDVAEGRYRLYVEGGLTDTLTGSAVYRQQENGRVGIELGPRDGPGLSIELTSTDRSRDPSGIREGMPPGRYNVVPASLLDRARADSLSGLIAFLSVADRHFTATRGHLSVTHAGNGTVSGRLAVKMAERTGGPSVRVTGVLRATRP